MEIEDIIEDFKEKLEDIGIGVEHRNTLNENGEVIRITFEIY